MKPSDYATGKEAKPIRRKALFTFGVVFTIIERLAGLKAPTPREPR